MRANVQNKGMNFCLPGLEPIGLAQCDQSKQHAAGDSPWPRVGIFPGRFLGAQFSPSYSPSSAVLLSQGFPFGLANLGDSQTCFISSKISGSASFSSPRLNGKKSFTPK